MKKTLIFIVLLLGAATVLVAQRSELGVFGGVSYYNGELNPNKPFLLSKPAYGLVYRYNLNTRLALRLNLLEGTLQGNGSNAFIPVIASESFMTKIDELSVQMEFNYFKYFTGSKLSFASPYVFAGYGIFMFDPTIDRPDPLNEFPFVWRSQWESAEGGTRKKFASAIPFGIGFKYSVSHLISLSAEWGMRKTFTLLRNTKGYNHNTADYIDDIHVLRDEGSEIQRGNPNDNDWYSFAGAMITVKLIPRKRADCSESHKIKL